jgi:hypothetical protein
MKSALLAFVMAATFTANAQESPPPSPEAEKIVNEPATGVKLSPEVSQKLTDKLPKYAQPPTEPEKPTPPEPATAAGVSPVDSTTATDPEILHLKKVTVTPRKRPRLTDDAMMTTKAYNDKLANEKLSSLDRNVLNKFTLPSWFGGVSAAERAREERNRELRTQTAADVFSLAKVVEVSDPEQAKALRDAMNRP